MTLREIGLVMDAAAMRDARLAWQAAQYARFAYHQPNDMPPDPASDRLAAPQVDPEVQAEIERIRLRVKLEADRRRHGS